MGGTKYSVLIVDDQDNWRELLTEILEGKFDVISVRSQSEAIDKISDRSNPFHVVVTDMRLVDEEPGNVDGLKLLEYLHKQEDKTKTILVTGYPTLTSQRRAFSQLSVYDYLEKRPLDGSKFNSDEFERIVQTAAIEAERSRNRLAFMLMPFADEYKLFYEEAIKKVIEEMRFDCKRADDFYQSRNIMKVIVKCIEDAKFIIADFSGRNPNVFLEVGISHAVGKNVLLLTQDLKDIPPKLQTVRCHVYESSLEGVDKIGETLRNAVQETQHAISQPFFARQKFGVLSGTCLALMPANETGERAYKALVHKALDELRCKVEKADEIFNSNFLLDEIWARINSAQVVIADLSDRDPDVFYLAGLAYGLKKKIIFLAGNGTDIPFDLKAGSHLVYSLDPFAEGFKAKQKLVELVRDLINN